MFIHVLFVKRAAGFLVRTFICNLEVLTDPLPYLIINIMLRGVFLKSPLMKTSGFTKALTNPQRF